MVLVKQSFKIKEEYDDVRPIFKLDYFSEAEPFNTVLWYPIKITF